jgi:hypothetical protein
MPVVSERQRRAMYAAEEGKSTLGIPAKVGRDFINATPKGKKLPESAPKAKRKPLGDEFGRSS